jgi:sialic acid synthase SpsE
VDSAFSLETEEMKPLVIEAERPGHSLCEVTYGLRKPEEDSIIFNRSL